MRHRDLRDYQPSAETPGAYDYTGAYYVPSLQGKALRKRKWLLCLLCALQLPLLYLMGRLDTPGFRQLYVILPFLLLMYFCGRALISALSLWLWREMMTKRQHEQSAGPLKGCLKAAPYAAGAVLLAEIVFLALGGTLQREWPLLPLLLALALLDLYTSRLTEGLGLIIQPQGKAAAGDPLLGPESTTSQD